MSSLINGLYRGNLPVGLEVPYWPNKPVVVSSSLGSGETVSVSKILTLGPQLSCTLNSLCIKQTEGQVPNRNVAPRVCFCFYREKGAVSNGGSFGQSLRKTDGVIFNQTKNKSKFAALPPTATI